MINFLFHQYTNETADGARSSISKSNSKSALPLAPSNVQNTFVIRGYYVPLWIPWHVPLQHQPFIMIIHIASLNLYVYLNIHTGYLPWHETSCTIHGTSLIQIMSIVLVPLVVRSIKMRYRYRHRYRYTFKRNGMHHNIHIKEQTLWSIKSCNIATMYQSWYLYMVGHGGVAFQPCTG